jgi:cytochrome c-type biogenesis protein CcmH
MIPAMEDTDRTPVRPRAATFALLAAGLLAVGAVTVKAFGGAAGEEPANESVANPEQPQSAEATIAALRDRLREDPDNDGGWYHLGLALRQEGMFAEAASAFRRASELRPQNADYVAYLGEVLLLQGGRQPPPEAERLFRRALEIEPGNPQARYYLATLRDSRGDHRGALEELLALLREAPADAPWEPQVRQAALTIGRENGIDIASRLPPQRPSTAAAAIPGPTREQIEAARGIPPSRQDAMVRGMVDGLAARLRANPRDAEGWIRLMRSRMVLNEPQEAADALRAGLEAFAGDASTQARLRRAASELAVPGT